VANPGVWTLLLLVGAGVHAGFQLTVTCVVHPALAAVPATSWGSTHPQHTHRISRLVAVVYVGVVVPVLGTLLTDARAATVAAAACSALALAVTAVVAAPLHTRLAAGRDATLVARLLAADRVRSLFAVAALAAALVAAVR
jgi:hypothetical protein